MIISGVSVIYVSFLSPSGSQIQQGIISRISGNANDGIYQGSFSFPQYGEAGNWSVNWIYVVDAVGNRQDYHQPDLAALGFPNTLQVGSSATPTPTPTLTPTPTPAPTPNPTPVPTPTPTIIPSPTPEPSPSPIPSATPTPTPGLMTVNTLDDEATPGDGLCSLREAINNANGPGTDTTGGDCAIGTGTDTISFSVSGTITLSGTLPSIANGSHGSLTIDGGGQTVVVDGANLYRALSVASGATLNLNGLAIGRGSAPDNGGGIENGGILTVTNCTFSGNVADQVTNGQGGGIANVGGSLTVTNTTFSGNTAADSGGAISGGAGTVSISNSTFTGNSATASFGGAIFAIEAASTLTIADSTFSGNTAGFGGGAVDCQNAVIGNSTFSNNSANSVGNGGGVNCVNATISDSTFTGNSGRFGGGLIDGGGGNFSVSNSTFSGNVGPGIYVENSTLTVGNSTFSDNSVGISNDAGTVTIENSVLAGNSKGNCSAAYTAIGNGGYNIADDATCGFGTSTGANGKTIGDNVNPLLASAGLQNNGGPTQTIALQATSPAVRRNSARTVSGHRPARHGPTRPRRDFVRHRRV